MVILVFLYNKLHMPHQRDFTRDMRLVRDVSARLSKRLTKENIEPSNIDSLSPEELVDLNKIVNLAHFMLCKYEEKKETKALLKSFVSILDDVSNSVAGIDDEIAELLVSAEDSISKVRNTHAHISDKSDLKHPKSQQNNNTTSNLICSKQNNMH